MSLFKSSSITVSVIHEVILQIQIPLQSLEMGVLQIGIKALVIENKVKT
jgi:hypothetical protein